MTLRLLLLILLCPLPALYSASARPAEPPSTRDEWTFNLYIENDLFSETDQYYTSGLRMSWVSPDLTDYIDDPQLPGWLRGVNKRLTFFHPSPEGLQRNVAVSLGQTIYTPEDRLSTDVVTDDRPYAGWLFTSFAYHTKTRRQLDTLEVQLGIVGPSALGHEAQDLIHEVRNFSKYNGWAHQLKDEIGLMLIYEHKQKMSDRVPMDGSFGYDIISHAGLALGNVGSYANAGIELRLGWLIPNDFGTSAVRPGGDNNAPGSNWDPRMDNPGQWGFHFFASFDGRAVAQDIFLDGNSFKDSNGVDKEHWVGDISVGVSSVFHGVKVSYAQVFRSKEFKHQKESHSYGSLSLSFNF